MELNTRKLLLQLLNPLFMRAMAAVAVATFGLGHRFSIPGRAYNDAVVGHQQAVRSLHEELAFKVDDAALRKIAARRAVSVILIRFGLK